MNAKEFIKQYGWDEAILVCKHYYDAFYLFYLDNGELGKIVGSELFKHVQAYMLVQKRGGLSEAKAIEQQYWNSGVGSAMIVSMELKQAIELVESVG